MQKVKNLQRIEKVFNQNLEMMSDCNDIFDKETVKKLLKSEKDIEKDKTRKATEVIKEFRLKYGF